MRVLQRSAPWPSHPVADALLRLAVRDPELSASPAPLARGASLGHLRRDPRALEDLLARLSRRWATDSAHVVAGFLLGDVAWSVAAPLAGVYLADGRVLAVDEDSVQLRFDTNGRSSDIAVLTGRFSTSAGDPAAGHRDATIAVAPSLLPLLHDHVCTTLTPFVDALRFRLRRGDRTVWHLVGDAVASAALRAGRAVGDDGRGRALADALLSSGAPLQPGGRWVTHPGLAMTYRVRASCCLADRVAERARCLGCPLLSDDERHDREAAWLDQETR